ncbi:extensin [Iris pallida]|uniref:Extensin n=1 Tax=Iris pallida TaxID=29817 RepID=A0AAX6EQM3_IRIPA|nr:extensin [Iris pallida]
MCVHSQHQHIIRVQIPIRQPCPNPCVRVLAHTKSIHSCDQPLHHST